MGYGDYLKSLLRPLGLYRLEDSYNGKELESYGQALDRCEAFQEETEGEMLPLTAQDFGLDNYLKLLRYRPAAEETESLRQALLAALHIRGGAFTPEALNAAIAGCGVEAAVTETSTRQVVEVRFPGVSGVPDNFTRLQTIIEEILPCHLQINYIFWTTRWRWMMESALTWGDLSDNVNTWSAVMSMGE